MRSVCIFTTTVPCNIAANAPNSCTLAALIAGQKTVWSVCDNRYQKVCSTFSSPSDSKPQHFDIKLKIVIVLCEIAITVILHKRQLFIFYLIILRFEPAKLLLHCCWFIPLTYWLHQWLGADTGFCFLLFLFFVLLISNVDYLFATTFRTQTASDVQRAFLLTV